MRISRRWIIVAADPGKDGGIAIIDARTGEVIAVIKMPCFKIKKTTKRKNKNGKASKGTGTKRVIDYAAVAAWLNEVILPTDHVRAVVEHLDPMPKFGAVSNFDMGASMHLLVGMFASRGWKVKLMRGREWQQVIFGPKHKKDKDLSRHKAAEIVPQFASEFLRARNRDGMAEACLIGIARYRLLRGLYQLPVKKTRRKAA